jgi:hypothetical protein
MKKKLYKAYRKHCPKMVLYFLYIYIKLINTLLCAYFKSTILLSEFLFEIKAKNIVENYNYKICWLIIEINYDI